MHPIHGLLLIASLTGLAGCSGGPGVEIANNDSAGLVRAIREANQSPGHDTIRLARNGLYILSHEVQAGLLLPSIRGGLTLEGNHAEIRGYSAHPAAILDVEEFAQVELRDLTIAEGTDGAIRNYGELKLVNLAIVDSSVSTLPAIVLNHGRLEAQGTRIAYNLLLSNRRDAGTVLNYGELKFKDSSIHGNRAIGRYRSIAAAGGVLNFGTIDAEALRLEDNEVPGDDTPELSFGGILNLGNGRFHGTTTNGAVRNARELTMIAGR